MTDFKSRAREKAIEIVSEIGSAMCDFEICDIENGHPCNCCEEDINTITTALQEARDEALRDAEEVVRKDYPNTHTVDHIKAIAEAIKRLREEK